MKPTEGNPQLTFRRKPIATIVSYLLLIGGSTVFAIPFFWLVTTSTKVDREMFSEDRSFLPMRPTARLQSPYIDDEYHRKPPDDYAAPFLPVVERVVREKKFPCPPEIRREDAERQLAVGILKKMQLLLPEAEWTKGEGVIEEHVREVATPLVLREQFQSVYRRFILGKLIIRSYHIETQELGEGEPMARRLENRTPATATLTDVNDSGTTAALLRYDFTQGDEVVLERTFRTDFDLTDLHRVGLSMRPDDGWQRLTLSIEKLGARYEAVRPAHLANFNWFTQLWQEPGPDDSSNRIKSWIHLRKMDEGPQYVSDPRQLKVTIRLQKTTQPQAWWGKLSLNYILSAAYIPFLRYTATSLFLILLNVVLMIFSSSIVAYAVSRLVWPGRDFVFLLMLATLMVPPQVTMIPGFLVWKNLGGYNTLTPLWFGSALGAAFNIFLLRQFMKGIPRDVEDAAKIDGCGILRVYWHIILPLVKPTLAAIALFTAIGTWNDFKGPLLYIADQRLYPMAFGLYAFAVQVANNPALTLAASLFMTLPVITLFFLAQKHFIRGVTLTGSKG